MKNVIKTIFISLIAILALSCAQENLDQKSSITVQLPGVAARDAVTTQTLSYVLTATPEGKKGKLATAEGLSGESLTVEVQVGTYTVNLKAYAQDDVDRATLLYEGTKTGVEVLYKQDTAITLKLTKMTTDAPAEDKPVEEEPVEDELEDVKPVEVSLKGMTVKAVDTGFEITIKHTSENSTWTYATIEEKSSGTSYDLWPVLDKLNNNESITFIYPFVTKGTEYEFAFANDDDEVPAYCSKIKAEGGSGELDYAEFDKLKVSLTNGNYKERFLNIENLSDKTTNFIKNYSNIDFVFKLYSGTKDWADTAFAYERDCTTATVTDKPELYYYADLLKDGKINIFNTKYEWSDLEALNTKLSERANYFAEIGYYFSDNATNSNGRFVTKTITSEEAKYTPISKEGVAEISISVAVPTFVIKGSETVVYGDKDYTFEASPVSGKFNDGTKFVWTINDVEIKDATTSKLTFNPVQVFGIKDAGNKLKCTAVYNKTYMDASFDFGIFFDPGIVIWNGSDDSENLFAGLGNPVSKDNSFPVGIQFYNKPQENMCVDATSPIAAMCSDNSYDYISAFCFDYKTGDVYFAALDIDENYDRHVYFVRYNPESKTCMNVYNTSLTEEVKSMAYLDGCIYFVSESAELNAEMRYVNELGKYEIHNYENPVSKNIDSPYPYSYKNGYSHEVVCITSDDKYLYTVSSDPNFDVKGGYYALTKTTSDGTKVLSTDIMHSENNRTVSTQKIITVEKKFNVFLANSSKNLLSSTKTTGEGSDVNLLLSSEPVFKISDIQCNGDYLYLLLAEESKDRNLVRGGLLRYNVNNNLKIEAFAQNQYVLGWYKAEKDDNCNPINIALETGSLPLDVFYRPTRFAALKPDVLYIADETTFIYYDDQNETTGCDINRLVTIDLKNYSIDEISVKANLSGKHNGCGFISY